MRHSSAIINTLHLKQNLTKVRELAPGAGIMAIVKANAYGHGMLEVSKILVKENVDYLGVALIDEAVAIREKGISVPILVLVPENFADASLYVQHNIEAAVSSLEFVRELSDVAVKRQRKAQIHIYIDTGMGRDGVYANEALYFVKKCFEMPNIEPVGICTHFATSGSDAEYTKYQLDTFKRVLNSLYEKGYTFKYVHTSNSAAIINFPDARFNLVRPGLALYGYSPVSENSDSIGLKPVMEFKTKVILIRSINKGDSVGYGREFISDRDTKIATIPVGYGDGYLKTLSHKTECIINGRRFPIVGTVCMDECMVDVGNSEINVGDDVVLIGRQGDESITAYDLAGKAGTIPYEITTNISTRVPRILI